MKNRDYVDEISVVSSGITGLDEILGGGFPANHVYLIEGIPGTGKTTLALQFILEGVRQGEQTLYISLSETKKDLEFNARSHGWDLSQVEILELLMETTLAGQESTLMFQPSEIELTETMKKIVDTVERMKPDRIALDSLSEIRLQSQTSLRYRREVLALRQFLAQHPCTTLLLDELPEEMTAQSVVHGIIELYRETPNLGPTRRRIQITKLRGVPFQDGFHDFVFKKGGLKIFPRLQTKESRSINNLQLFPSDSPSMNALLGGGIPSGSTTLLIGPAGSGKSSTATHFVNSALRKGKCVANFFFEESTSSYLLRASSLGMDLEPYLQDGSLLLQQVAPGEFSVGHFTHIIQKTVKHNQVKMLVIDSLNGFFNAMPDEKSLVIQLHEIATWLNQHDIITLLIMSQTGLFGSVDTPADTSYLTDNIILFRMFEAFGEVRHAISVVKKRSGNHERTVREFKFSPTGIQIGEPLTDFQGILTGTPHYLGGKHDLIVKNETLAKVDLSQDD